MALVTVAPRRTAWPICCCRWSEWVQRAVRALLQRWRCLSQRSAQKKPRLPLRVFPDGRSHRARAEGGRDGRTPGDAHSTRRYHDHGGDDLMKHGPTIAKAAFILAA